VPKLDMSDKAISKVYIFALGFIGNCSLWIKMKNYLYVKEFFR